MQVRGGFRESVRLVLTLLQVGVVAFALALAYANWVNIDISLLPWYATGVIGVFLLGLIGLSIGLPIMDQDSGTVSLPIALSMALIWTLPIVLTQLALKLLDTGNWLSSYLYDYRFWPSTVLLCLLAGIGVYKWVVSLADIPTPVLS